ncbi:GerAB/ArcD/ProY family transporter [Paenibacillus chondroitinus]|uniref:GerAB/ArcD/ProY family transporter n=1 Tax=Paenibacillus chondroitinus TaxID=59842 RepID=A0ABU6DLD2_9BACL|nr:MULTISPECIES: GerAB/ArcD/ProY family transporter [Paenibacillus]MCY9660708.1 spore germination protein [Paenibacillus anseongense]MEB4798112.1 GerAB/ArcD/ProY family transporter [Paenibacillus chondroitinus]
MRKLQITNGMFIAMVVNVIFAKAIGVTQGVLARAVGQDMWVATLLGTLQGAVMMFVTYIVLRRTPHLNYIELSALLLGKWFGKIIALLIFVFFLGEFGPIMITFVYHLKDYFLPEAPVWLFTVSSLIVGAIGCYYGLEVMGRIALIGLLFIFLLNTLIILGSTNEFDIRNLLPFLEHGFLRTAAASLHFDVDWALAVMLGALIIPYVNGTAARGGQLSVISILASGMLVIIWAILEGAVLSAEVTSQYTISCMKLARNAHIGNFLQRYEMIMIALYSVSVLFEVMFCIYGSSVSLASILGLKSNKTMILPVCLILGVFGTWIVEDHFRAIDYLEHVWPKIALPVAIGLPLILLGLRMLLRKKLDGVASS